MSCGTCFGDGWYGARLDRVGAEHHHCDCGAECGACLPKWADLYGAAPNYTGGQDVNEWLDERQGES